MTIWVLNGLKLIFSWFFTILKAIIWQALVIIQALFSSAWTAIKLLVSAVFTWITEFITDILSGLVTIVGAWLNLLTDGWTKGMEGLGNVVNTVWDGIKNTIANGINWVIDKINWLIEKANAISSKVWGPTITAIPPLAFEKGGIVPWFQTGGIVPGGKNPANHDQIPAMLDPGELILNRSQQANLAKQLTSNGSSQNVIQLNFSFALKFSK